MNPMIIENTRAVNTTVKCSACFEPAQLVWIDEWGTRPFCRECSDRREAAWNKRNKATNED
jgi:endogenous inhibitor of DNA gyrase (YacG/DUF329 family)